MIRPRYPVPDTYQPTTETSPGTHTPVPYQIHTPMPAPMPAPTHHAAPTPVSGKALQVSPAGLVTAVAAGAGAFLIVGAVLVSLLLAVAITAMSITVCALVLKSLLANQQRKR